MAFRRGARVLPNSVNEYSVFVVTTVLALVHFFQVPSTAVPTSNIIIVLGKIENQVSGIL